MFENEVAELRQLGQRLLASEDDVASCSDAELVDRIAGLERLVAHAQAQLMVETTRFLRRRRTGGWNDPAERTSDVKLDAANDELALARGVSATTAALFASLGDRLQHDMPACFAALNAGRISLHAARMIAAETDVLTQHQRAQIDEAVALEATGLLPGQVRDAVRARVAAVDAEAAAKRARKARADRQVGVVNKPDGVGLVFGRLPAEDAHACFDALDTHARCLRAAGDERAINDIMCDTFITRLTGTAGGASEHRDADTRAGAETAPPARRVEVGIAISAASWLGLDDTPAHLHGYGAIPAPIARDIVERAHPDHTWIRRLLTDPNDGQVLAMGSRARKAGRLLRCFHRYRDQVCRRPYCTNTIEDINHVRPYAEGGTTDHTNTDGLCARCHLSRHRDGWTQEGDALTGTIVWRTPTGHTYPSHPPPAVGYGTLSAGLLRLITQHPSRAPSRRPAA